VITSYEYAEVRGERVTADIIVWRRYRKPAPGIVEAMLDANPVLAKVHKFGPFLPVGLVVRIPIDQDIMAGLPVEQRAITLYGD
jgi:phage tail protein X